MAGLTSDNWPSGKAPFKNYLKLSPELHYLTLRETNKVKTFLDFVKICWEEEEV